MAVWTKEEEQLLLDNYKTKTMKELQELLNKTDGSIRGKKTLMGLRKSYNPITEEEKQVIVDYYTNHKDNFSLDELSSLIGRPKTSISRFARSLNLTDIRRPLSEESIEKSRKTKHDKFESGEYDELRKRTSENTKKWIAENGHPKGMLGKHHSDDTRKRMSQSHIELEARTPYEEKHRKAMKIVKTKKDRGLLGTTTNAYSRCYGFFRPDLNQYFRSAWEANMARIYNHNNIKWEYESKRFLFENPVCSVESYQPDFYLPELDKWVEVKGWMDDKSIIRLVLFKQEYPEEYDKLEIIGANEYYALYKQYKSLENFELEYADRKRLESMLLICEKENRING